MTRLPSAPLEHVVALCGAGRRRHDILQSTPPVGQRRCSRNDTITSSAPSGRSRLGRDVRASADARPVAQRDHQDRVGRSRRRRGRRPGPGAGGTAASTRCLQSASEHVAGSPCSFFSGSRVAGRLRAHAEVHVVDDHVPESVEDEVDRRLPPSSTTRGRPGVERDPECPAAKSLPVPPGPAPAPRGAAGERCSAAQSRRAKVPSPPATTRCRPRTGRCGRREFPRGGRWQATSTSVARSKTWHRVGHGDGVAAPGLGVGDQQQGSTSGLRADHGRSRKKPLDIERVVGCRRRRTGASVVHVTQAPGVGASGRCGLRSRATGKGAACPRS